MRASGRWAQETFSLFLMGKKQMVTAGRTMPRESSKSVEKFLQFVIEQKLSWRIPKSKSGVKSCPT